MLKILFSLIKWCVLSFGIVFLSQQIYIGKHSINDYVFSIAQNMKGTETGKKVQASLDQMQKKSKKMIQTMIEDMHLEISKNLKHKSLSQKP